MVEKWLFEGGAENGWRPRRYQSRRKKHASADQQHDAAMEAGDGEAIETRARSPRSQRVHFFFPREHGQAAFGQGHRRRDGQFWSKECCWALRRNSLQRRHGPGVKQHDGARRGASAFRRKSVGRANLRDQADFAAARWGADGVTEKDQGKSKGAGACIPPR